MPPSAAQGRSVLAIKEFVSTADASLFNRLLAAAEAKGFNRARASSKGAKSIAFNELFAPAEASPEPESVTYRVVAAGRVGLVSRIEESGH
ncbi:hypothetical protein Acr_07g0014630 [Actinidia rufa]|uniref:Uncharacterized protein n=1 Tax=Actinidia rufa TaxID=165716 RepID=A0A7J0F055_9ERIC|nr:hypothetical protein Acr_07g0014630 [Actinidia rufa]